MNAVMLALATRSGVGVQTRSPALTGPVTGSLADRSMGTLRESAASLTWPSFA